MARRATTLPRTLLACVLCLCPLGNVGASALRRAPLEEPAPSRPAEPLEKHMWLLAFREGEPLSYKREDAFKVSAVIKDMYKDLGEPESEDAEDNCVPLPGVKNKEVFLRLADLCKETPGNKSEISLEVFAALLMAANFLEIPREASAFFFEHISETALRGPSSREIFCSDMYEKTEDPDKSPDDASPTHVFAAPRGNSVYASLLHGFAKTLGLETRTLAATVTENQKQRVVKTMTICSKDDPCESYGVSGDSREGYQHLKITPKALDVLKTAPPTMNSVSRSEISVQEARALAVWASVGWFFKHMGATSLDLSGDKADPSNFSWLSIDDAKCISEIGAVTLNVSGCSLDEAALAQLLSHDHTKSGLQALDISLNSALGPDSIAALDALQSLSELKISKCSPSRAALTQILDSEKIRSALHTLDVSGARYLDESADPQEDTGLSQQLGLRSRNGILQKIASLGALQSLGLFQCNLAAGSLAKMLSGEIKNSLRTLDVSRNKNLNQLDRQAISDLALYDLNLENCDLPAGSLAEILRGKISESLRTLDVSWNDKMNQLDRQAISDLTLYDLNLEGCDLADGSLAEILRGQIMNSLHTLNISFNQNLTLPDRQAISNLTLHDLNLIVCELAAGSLAEILRGQIMNSLHTLNVSLNLNLNQLDRQAISALAIRDLNLENCTLGPGSLAEILRGQIMNSLRTLNVSENWNLNQLDRRAISALALYDLNLEGCGLAAGSLAEILRGQIMNSLHTLNVSLRENINQLDRQAISALAIRDLNLEGCGLPAGSLAEMLSGEIKESLRTLDVSRNKNLNQLDRQAISILTLQSLKLRGCKLDPGSLAEILNGEIKDSLRTLDVSSNQDLNQLDRQAMSPLTLNYLNLDGCGLPAGFLAEILRGEIKNSLCTLDVSRNKKMNQLDRKEISNITLYDLHLENCALNPGSLAEILRGKIKNSLRTLKVSWNKKMNQSDRKAISILALQSLKLGGCKLDPGSLAEMLSRKITNSLRTLNVSWNKNMNEKDRQAISSLALHDLNLDGCDLPAGSLAKILRGEIKKSLRALYFASNRNLTLLDRQEIDKIE